MANKKFRKTIKSSSRTDKQGQKISKQAVFCTHYMPYFPRASADGQLASTAQQTVRARRLFVVIAVSLSHHASLFWQRYKGRWLTRRTNFKSAAVDPGASRFGAAVDDTHDSFSSWKTLIYVIKTSVTFRTEELCSDCWYRSAVMRPPTEYDGGARVPAEAEEGDARAPAMMICARLAGRAIIRVVGRCEDAQENSQLGVYHFSLF